MDKGVWTLKKILSWLLAILFTGVVLVAGVFFYWYIGSVNYLLTGLPVANYHQVNNKYQTVLTMKPEDFEEQMKYLHDNDYHAISQKQFDDYMTGRGTLPDRPILITFDDGYIDNYEEAYPIMKKYGMRGTIFLITSLVNTPRYLTWAQIQEMSQNGIEFGSHTVSHKPLTSFDRDGVRRELRESKAILEKKLGRPCPLIAFPEGKFNDMVMEETKAAGYKYGFTVDTGRVFPWDDPYDLERVPFFEGPRSFDHFRFRLTFSAFSSLLWKTHKTLERMDWSKSLAEHVPQP